MVSFRRFGLVALVCVAGSATYSVAQEPTLAEPGHRHDVLTTRGPSRILDLPEEEGVFQFVIYGDRTGGVPAGLEVLKQAVADTNLVDPDLVMTVGDLVQGYNRTPEWLPQMREFRQIMDGLTAPWFPVAGNHDVYWERSDRNKPPGEHEANYEEHFGPLWYAFRHKNAGFVALYTDEGDPESGEKGFNQGRLQRMSSEQLGFLQQALESLSDVDHVFVFMHHPRWIGGGYTGGNWERVHRVLAEAGNVKAVFAGHIHRMRYDGTRDGIQYYALATTGGHLSRESPGLGYLHHFNVVTVRPERISVATVPVGGVIDPQQFTQEFLQDAMLASGARPRPIGEAPSISLSGSVDGIQEFRIQNPSSRAVEITVSIDASADWMISPPHVHEKLQPQQETTVKFRLRRSSSGQGAGLTMPRVVSSVDYLGENARVSLGENDAPLSLPVAVEPSWFVHDRRAALQISGETSAVRVESSAISLGQEPFTLEAWVRAPEDLTGSRAIIAKTQSSGYSLFMSGNRPQFDVRIGNRYASAKSSLPLIPGEWMHVAGIYDGESVRIFINGRQSGTADASGDRVSNSLPLYLGADPDGSGAPTRSFRGLLDEVRLSRGVRYSKDFEPQDRFALDNQTLLLFHLDRTLGPLVLSETGTAGRLVNGAELVSTDR